MEVQALQHSVDAWFDDFTGRFPGRITATGEAKVRLLQLLHQIEAVRTQQFARDTDGQPVFRFLQVAQSLGISPRSAMNGALASSLVAPHIRWVQFQGAAKEVPGLTLGGLVCLVAVISPGRYRSLTQQRAHHQRRSLAVAIMRALPDTPDVGALINRLVEPAVPRHMH